MLTRRQRNYLLACIMPALAVTGCGQKGGEQSSLHATLAAQRLAAPATPNTATRSYQDGQYQFYSSEQSQQPAISADEARSIFEKTGTVPSAVDAQTVEAQFADFVNSNEALPSAAVDGKGPSGSAPVWQLIYHNVTMPYHGPVGSTTSGKTYVTDLIVAVSTNNKQFLVAFTGTPDAG